MLAGATVLLVEVGRTIRKVAEGRCTTSEAPCSRARTAVPASPSHVRPREPATLVEAHRGRLSIYRQVEGLKSVEPARP